MVRWSSFPFIPGLHGLWLGGFGRFLGFPPPPLHQHPSQEAYRRLSSHPHHFLPIRG